MTIADLTPRDAGLLDPVWLGFFLLIWLGLLISGFHSRFGRLRRLAPTLAAVGGLLIGFLVFFWRPLLTPAGVPRGGGDLNSFFFPLHAFSAERLLSGDLPLWNPHLHAGMPHLANYQAALLYPPNLLAWLGTSDFGYATMEWLALIHFLVASFGAYALARTLGLGRLPAVAAGLIFPYSGFLVAHLGHYSMLSIAAWLPWLLAIVRRLGRSGAWLWSGVLAVVVYLMDSAGHQQTLLYGLLTAGVWWLYWLVVDRQLVSLTSTGLTSAWRLSWANVRPLLADALRFTLGMAIGLSLAAPMILPSLQLAGRSVRAGLSYEQATEFSIQPVALLQFILPKAFGSNPTDYWGPFSSGEIWGYVGVVALVLAALALAVRVSSGRLFLVGLLVVALLYALGPWAPVHGWFFRFVPLFDLVRAPARAYLLVDLALALLAAYGIAELAGIGSAAIRTRLMARRISLALLVVLAALALFVIPLFYSLILGVNDPSNRPVIAVDGLNLLLLYLGGVTLVLWLVSRGRVGGLLAALLLLVLAVLDLFGATSTFNPTSEDLTAGFRHDEAVEFLQDRMATEGRFRIEAATTAWQPNLAVLAGLDDIGGLFDPMQPADYARARETATADRSLPLYDLLGARYLILTPDAGSPGPDFVEAAQTADGLVIWENPGALPRVWLAYSVRQVDRETALQMIRRPDFAPERELLLSGDLPALEGSGSGSATITSYQPDAVHITVESSSAAYLVLADLDYPGWIAAVDGESTPVATADGLFRAVRVPSGRHEVVFKFQPPLARAGFVISAAGLVGLLVLTVIALRQRTISGRPVEEQTASSRRSSSS